jgi:tetratricopeptide (TPR) repeat protein
MPLMKNSIPLHSLWILLVLVSCSNEQQTKSKIIQYPITLAEEIQGPIKEAILIAKPITVSLPPEPLIYPEEEPAPPEEPEPFFLIQEERRQRVTHLSMEEQWQRVINMSGYQARKYSEFCFIYGDTLMQRGKYREATRAYEKADEFGYRFLGAVHFKLAKLQMLEDSTYYYHVEESLERAVYYGFNDYQALLEDEAFEYYRGLNEFIKMYCNLFENNQAALFEGFIAFAPKTNLTEAYDLSPVNLFENINARNARHNMQHLLIYTDFNLFAEGAEGNSFSRFVNGNCRYEMCWTEKKYRAIIYSIEEQWSEYTLPKKYFLVTYDLKGNKISELEVAKRGSLKTCKGFSLQPDKSLVVTNYKVKWKIGTKKALGNNGFLNYKHLKKTIVKSTQAYQITDSGRLVEIEDLLVVSEEL